MAPDKEFEDKDTFFSEIRSLNEVGISPLMELEDRFKVLRFWMSVRELGIFPRSLLPEKIDVGSRGLNLDVGDGEVLEVSEPDAGEAAEGVDACEGVDGGDEVSREADWSSRAVEELEGLNGGEGFEGGEGEDDVIGAVGEAKGKEVAVSCQGLMVTERRVLGGYGR
ncbi:hypothetical protein C1H46_032334 [Malus baccata]|uniref:Uncharacterized protein n=1 Tax=Malus baccata TaxID=106549 RepID=A0A540L6J8_MALBA|nr:hypothetical protein C1H46_032334 [Malus baccata]